MGELMKERLLRRMRRKEEPTSEAILFGGLRAAQPHGNKPKRKTSGWRGSKPIKQKE